MSTQILKWFTMAALLAGAMLWRSSANSPLPQFLLGFVVCFGAGVVALQAVRAKKYLWAIAFAGILMFFNPLIPIFPFDGELGRLMVLASIVPFAISLAVLKTQPVLSAPSITGRDRGGLSL